MTEPRRDVTGGRGPADSLEANELLEVRDLQVVYRRRRGLLGRGKDELRAVDGVTLSVREGEAVGLVGESGSGKSTVAQAVTRLVPVDSGSITLRGRPLSAASGKELRDLRRELQMVFQDPYSSLDPSMTIRSALREPLHVLGLKRSVDVERVLHTALDAVGLPTSSLDKFPHEFSGGQRQRIAIARALVPEPTMLILDEAVSALDVSTQAQVLSLLQDLRRERGLAYLFIGHDLAVVRRMSDRIAVMYLGRIVEEGPAERVVSHPAHPYTAALLAAVPDGRKDREHDRRKLIHRGANPDPWNRPVGCSFATRCPFAMDICFEQDPQTTGIRQGGTVDCHLQTSGATLAGEVLGDLVADHEHGGAEYAS
ncbi:ABC transporter ATP-binding protein [uncultured Serinicoccus sp.]|uniref:ABC transporter ATP-binding protein n=1 Tax=uncultured Serinicoccus sp. TaxID=735514 RepID=UPI0026268A62|nr:ABC transporter ATP-binding protein [uncultured Serinicoccus sp.]